MDSQKFSHSSGILVTSHEEETVFPAGDVVLRKKCTKITLNETQIVWDRKLNNRNKEQGGNITFLELPSHRLSKQGRQITCAKRAMLFIKDLEDNIHAIHINGTLKSYIALQDEQNTLKYQGQNGLFANAGE